MLPIHPAFCKGSGQSVPDLPVPVPKSKATSSQHRINEWSKRFSYGGEQTPPALTPSRVLIGAGVNPILPLWKGEGVASIDSRYEVPGSAASAFNWALQPPSHQAKVHKLDALRSDSFTPLVCLSKCLLPVKHPPIFPGPTFLARQIVCIQSLCLLARRRS